MNPNTHRVLAAACAALAVALVGAGASSAAPTTGPLVSATTTSLGKALVNTQGRTLYLFGKDKQGKSACTGACAANWPPLIASGKPRAGAGVKASLLGTTKRADGRMQVTYNHHPLYLFVNDTKKGQTNGEGLNAFGGVWDAISPSGAKLSKPSSVSTGGGNGY